MTLWFLSEVVFLGYDLLCLPLQDHLQQLVSDNEQLKAEVRELLNSSALSTSPRHEGEVYLLTLLLFVTLFICHCQNLTF